MINVKQRHLAVQIKHAISNHLIERKGKIKHLVVYFVISLSIVRKSWCSTLGQVTYLRVLCNETQDLNKMLMIVVSTYETNTYVKTVIKLFSEGASSEPTKNIVHVVFRAIRLALQKK